VAQTFLVDETIRTHFLLNRIVTVVDAKHVSDQLERRAEAREQIAFADVVLLNKTDLATTDELDLLEQKIAGSNRMATIVRTRNSEIDIDPLFDTGTTLLEQRIATRPAGEGHHHSHTDDIATVCIVERGEIDGLKLSAWFRQLITEHGPDIMRMKGILNLRGDPDRFVFQGVHMLFEGKPGEPWGTTERVNRLVFIGRQLDEAAIVRGFRSCLVSSDDDASTARDPFGRNVEVSRFTLEQIRYWMRQIFSFPTDCPIVIKEVPCVKPGCPPIETAIMAVLKHEPPRLFKIQQTINEVNFDSVYNLIENPMPCC
jgi:hypothetical protein